MINEAEITSRYIDRILEGDEMNEVIEIKDDAPGAVPMPEGGLGSLIGLLAKFGPAINTFVSGLIAGSATFEVSYHGLARWVTISDKPPA